jgi:hypothetical protein
MLEGEDKYATAKTPNSATTKTKTAHADLNGGTKSSGTSNNKENQQSKRKCSRAVVLADSTMTRQANETRHESKPTGYASKHTRAKADARSAALIPKGAPLSSSSTVVSSLHVVSVVSNRKMKNKTTTSRVQRYTRHPTDRVS